jgi:DNA-binding GntR family transcriptional regulator
VAIDPNSAVSLSAQVKADILARIRSGEYVVGEKIPSLRSLAAQHTVAELTIHAAVKELQYEGVLESASGRGTFVRALPDDAPADLAATVDELRREVAELRERVAAVEETQRR